MLFRLSCSEEQKKISHIQRVVPGTEAEKGWDNYAVHGVQVLYYRKKVCAKQKIFGSGK